MKISYRPEIDGLRAISVFAIIIYHANFFFDGSLFSGGFIGVDIFFVISGYLITSLIIKEILKTNQFSFKYFYERRIRRILPVLFFIIIATSITSYFILLPSSLIDLAKSVFSIIFFSSNIYFWVTGNKYGDESELLRPLLHTWSLSVEEQFYILFPIFLVIIIKHFKQGHAAIIFIIFSFSLIFAQWSSTSDLKITYTFFSWKINFFDKFNFYCLQSRIFELLIGSLLSYFELKNGVGGRKSYSILNQICPSLGIILIIYSFLSFNYTKIPHPSVTTLIPLLGVSLIIYFSKKGELITEILSSKIFVFFGLISYSLYLWHYPIFAFLRYIDIFNNSIWVKLLAVLLTIVLSIFSYYLIERPFRNENIISIKKLTAYILISLIILLSYSFYILKTSGIKSRFPNIITERLLGNLNNDDLNRTGKNLNNVLLIGDSHADALKYHLNEKLTKQSYNFYRLDGYYYLKNFNLINRKDNTQDKDYIRDNEKIDNFLQEYKNLVVVWNQRWSIKLLEEYFDNKEGYAEYKNEQDRYTTEYLEPINIKIKDLKQRQKYIIEGIKSTAKNILEKEHALILIYPVPEMGFDVPRLFATKYLFSKIFDKKLDSYILSSGYDVYRNRNKMIFDTLDSIEGPNVYRLFPHKYFCNTVIVNRCIANNNEHLFYYDDNHLSLEGSKYVVNDIIKIIEQIDINKETNK
jgi:peptidoglycan/LPS O-acetylase OafA/YrhL